MPLEVPRPVTTAQARAWRTEGWWLDMTLPALLHRRATESPAAPAIIGGERTLTFADLAAESDRVATGLARLGIGRGDVVSCQLANGPEILLLHLAVAKRRAIFNPIHLPYRAAEIEGILRFAESRMMVVGPSRRGVSGVEMVRGLRQRLPALRHVVAVGEESGGDVVPFGALAAERGEAIEAARPEDPFLLLFTSGTTASPKATLHTHAMRLGNARLIARDVGWSAEDRVVSIARWSHMWGVMTYWMSLWVGASQVLLAGYSPDALADVVSRHQATIAIGAPPHVADLLARPELATRFASLRLFLLSGSVCPPALVRGLREAVGCTPLMLWGMTETAGGIYTRPDDPAQVVEETVGRVTPGCAIAVLDETGRALLPGDEGELAIRSPFAFEGYVNNPAATAESFTADGWFRTGDVASIDAAGNVRILGRRKEQINRGGVKFHPADVEDVLLRHPAVQLAALVGMPDPRLGERNCCVVVTRPGRPAPTLAELTALLDEANIAKFKWPERLVVRDALPLTPTGKVQRSILRELVSKEGNP